MSLQFPNDLPISENKLSTSFLQRNRLKTLDNINFTSDRPTKFGKQCPDKKMDWAELKTSLLVKTMLHDADVHINLLVFLQNITVNIFTFLTKTYKLNTKMRVNSSKLYFLDGFVLSSNKNKINKTVKNLIYKELTTYLKKMKKDKQKGKTRNYPVAQSQVRKTIDEIWNNFYPLWNFIKWIWYKLKQGTYYQELSQLNTTYFQGEIISYFVLIDMFQQRLLYFHDLIRGNRVDLRYKNENAEAVKNDQIGISAVKVTSLKRSPINTTTTNVEPWNHPGDAQCRVPFRGGYGKNIQQLQKENSYYASLQCGISGSTQYILFMYLLSICHSGTINSTVDVRNIISSCVLILAGDGGGC